MLEDFGAEGQHFVAVAGALQPDRARVAGIWSAADVPELLEVRGGLGCGLFADAEAAPELGDGGAVYADRLEREPVDWPRVWVAAGGQLGVQCVNHGAEGAGEQQGQLEPVAVWGHALIVAFPHENVNSVYDIVTLVDECLERIDDQGRAQRER